MRSELRQAARPPHWRSVPAPVPVQPDAREPRGRHASRRVAGPTGAEPEAGGDPAWRRTAAMRKVLTNLNSQDPWQAA